MSNRTVKVKLLWEVGLLFMVAFCFLAPVQASDVLKIKYYDNPQDFSHLDDKYKNLDKYLLYKYISFASENNKSYNNVTLTFLVDNNWYKKNRIQDVIFLKFADGLWEKINYQNKSLNYCSIALLVPTICYPF